ncbi:uncharacterized protein LOC124291729 [Haliotis rubra]|uniref:uncharacterized protein LOC124291729 n=1 Tax=Haliotis rubra TaxID=36100 RepID=UPI001EE55C47|nr:uncharacterized protein LOC124291729 [Haliotis rubra]
MSSPSRQDSDGADSDDTGEVTPGLYYSTGDSGSDVAKEEEEEEQETVRISNDFLPPLEAIYHRNNHHKTETREDTDVTHQNDDGQTNMSPSPLQGAVALTQGETQDLTHAIAETFSNAMSSVNTEQRVTNILINNPQLNLTKKTEVANLTAHNVSMGGQQVIQPSTSSDGAESQQKTQNRPTKTPKDSKIQRITDATVSEINTWTSGMIKIQFVDDIVKKIDAGQNGSQSPEMVVMGRQLWPTWCLRR